MTKASLDSDLAGQPEKNLAYSIAHAANLLQIDNISVFRLIQRKKVKATQTGLGRLSISQTELSRILRSK